MSLVWKQHPILTPPTIEEMARMDPKQLVQLWELFHEAIENAERDPYRYGFKLANWMEAEELLAKKNEILVSGGNRSSKTSWAAHAVVKAAIENEGSVIMCSRGA